MEKKVEARDLVKSYAKRRVVDGISLYLRESEIVGLLGPNGAGKTTCFYMIAGLIRPHQGAVYLNERNITHLPIYKRARLGIGYLPQEASIFRHLSIEDNLLSVLEMSHLSRKAQKKRMEELLSEFNLQHIRKHSGLIVSGGERRRTEIARSLAIQPSFLLLDEPFAGIDPIAIEEIREIILRVKKKGIGILITDHNVRETLSIVDRSYLVFEGKLLKSGGPTELIQDEEVKRLYLGSNFDLNSKLGQKDS
ncbi:MAG: LPS export ABC transporter ATP-binding protein [Cytophagales bacterium]|nr:LPS export ABC transporter ATP-binding protein [Cytophagales bacterium]